MSTPQSDPIVEFSMFITKATQDPEAKTMRWSAVTSDTERDLTTERMSVVLFRNFIKRIESEEPAPEPLQSKAWQGGKPYMSLAHYLDLDGYGIVGMADSVFVDNQLLKAKGTFGNSLNPKLAEAAFAAVRKDIKSDTPQEQRIRISIAFADYQHTHGDFVFKRKSLADTCPVCEAGQRVTEYQDGHLVHFALTRVPANPRTKVGLEEKSMATQLEDATSIVGEEVAKELEEKSKVLVGKSEVLVVKSEDTIASAPTTIAAIVGDPWNALEVVTGNIMEGAGKPTDKAAAVRQAIQDFRNMFNVAKSIREEVKPMTHVLDDSIAALKAAYDGVAADPAKSRNEKLTAVQEPLNALAASIKRSIDGNTPVDVDAIVQQAVEKAMQAFQGQIAQIQAPTLSAPAPRQITMASMATQPVQPQGPLTLHDIVRRSVLGPNA